VQQEKAALKVSTDSCLFGAWVAEEVRSTKLEVGSTKSEVGSTKSDDRTVLLSAARSTILDIGAGSGLLMLMLAQKFSASIDGIEIDEPSYEQAKENIEASPWKDRLQLFHADVKQFQFNKKYDLIISNPPFYEGDLKPELANRNVAMHEAGLKLDELVKIVNVNLTEEGSFAVLLPFQRADYFIALAESEYLFLHTHVQVRQTATHGFFRSMLLFSKKKVETSIEELAIKDASNQYSNEFVLLLKDYYLYL
jgi:tRNA1Val (adenine37-N6)-methyltransferase